MSLVRERDYDSIVVKEILDRANVGRSTFYTHFRDKHELLLSGLHDMIRSVQSKRLPSSANRYEKVIGFSLPIFEYIDQHRRACKARMGTTGRAVLHERLLEVLAERIADDVGKLQGRRKAAGGIPPELLAQYVASTFILVLNWWVESSELSAQEVNNLFRALALPALAAMRQ